MVFYFRPCSRRSRWRRRRLPAAVVKMLVFAACLGALVGLLFLAPQWVLVLLVVVLLFTALFLARL